ncbi:MAG: hypothetical protein ACOZF0_02480 [Thermodesulfobacteriota bacterium]
MIDIPTKRRRTRNLRKTGLILVSLGLILTGCSSSTPTLPVPDGLYAGYAGPQIAVTPTAIPLGIATLIKTPVVIAGTGFEPGDSVFVDIISTEEPPVVKIPVDASEVDASGGFTMEMSKEVKALEILKLDIDPSDLTPIVVRDPVPAGTYIVKAVSVASDRKAECIIQVVEAGKMDRLKDKIGTLLGKIRNGR